MIEMQLLFEFKYISQWLIAGAVENSERTV